MEYPEYYKKIPRKMRFSTKQKNETIRKQVEAKDRAWAILSDYTRMRDFVVYDGRCISSGQRVEDWRDFHAGHYASMGSSGAEAGFYDLNIHGQTYYENMHGGMESGGRYKDELIRRHGEQVIDEIEKRKRAIVKADEYYFIEKIKEIYGKFIILKETYPDYNYPEYLNCG
jgi:hypothetical protein